MSAAREAATPRASSPTGALARARHGVAVVWRFGRPHTLIGTALSVLGLAVIAVAEDRGAPLWDVLATLVAGLAVNISITGVNQITDVEIDRINKPFLPIAAGELSLRNAKRIVLVASILPLTMALTQGVLETAAVAAGLAVGAVYSLPPARLKRFPLAASLCITGVRSIVVNLGVYAHFAHDIAPPVIALCLFVLPFSFAIAVLKDVPDLEGDKRFSIRTYTVRLGPQRVKGIGLAALALAYAGMIFVGPFALGHHVQPVVLVAGHAIAAGLLFYWARAADPSDRVAFTNFYMRVWGLFFLEYVLVPLACIAS